MKMFQANLPNTLLSLLSLAHECILANLKNDLNYFASNVNGEYQYLTEDSMILYGGLDINKPIEETKDGHEDVLRHDKRYSIESNSKFDLAGKQLHEKSIEHREQRTASVVRVEHSKKKSIKAESIKGNTS